MAWATGGDEQTAFAIVSLEYLGMPIVGWVEASDDLEIDTGVIESLTVSCSMVSFPCLSRGGNKAVSVRERE